MQPKLEEQPGTDHLTSSHAAWARTGHLPALWNFGRRGHSQKKKKRKKNYRCFYSPLETPPTSALFEIDDVHWLEGCLASDKVIRVKS